LITGWLMYFGFLSNMKESLLGLLTAVSGIVIYFIYKRNIQKVLD
jgi:hypothetical protein